MPRIDAPVFDGKKSANSETTIVSQAIPSLEDLEFSGSRVGSVLTLGLSGTESVGPFGYEPIRLLYCHLWLKSPSTLSTQRFRARRGPLALVVAAWYEFRS